MLCSPDHWRKYYQGDDHAKHFARMYSFSDRSRYYWSDPDVQKAIEILFKNLEQRPIPLALISQFSPVQYDKVRAGKILNTPDALVRDRISAILENYERACGY